MCSKLQKQLRSSHNKIKDSVSTKKSVGSMIRPVDASEMRGEKTHHSAKLDNHKQLSSKLKGFTKRRE